MTKKTYNEIKKIIIDFISDDVRRSGMKIEDIQDDFDLLQSGLIDSFKFIDLISLVEEKSDIEIDLAELDAEGFATISGLINSIIETNNNQ